MIVPQIAGIKVPDSAVVIEATKLVQKASSALLFNHVIRSYVFAEYLGSARAVKYDRELLYLSAVMHDLGLTDRFEGPERFEVDGAHAARGFLRAHGLDDAKTQLVWDAIALHTSRGIAAHEGPEVALTQIGIRADFGAGIEEIPQRILKQILSAYPPLGLKKGFKEMLCGIAVRKPDMATEKLGRRGWPEIRPRLSVS